jgi:hypothetical protein
MAKRLGEINLIADLSYALKVEDTVRPFGKRRAGHDADAAAFFQRVWIDIAGCDGACDPEYGRGFVRCAGCLIASKRKSVIGTAVKRREISFGCQPGGQYAPICL